ncbi:MAG: serine--tRNA ligase [Nanoarchaeota archaeon]
MLDIKLFRENPETIKTSQKKRGKDEKLIDKVLELDRVWRELLQQAEELKRERNIVSEKINQMKKEGKAATAEIKKVKNVADEIVKLDVKISDTLAMRDATRYKIGNILAVDVPLGTNIKVVRTWGTQTKFSFTPKAHADIIEDLNVADVARAAELSGARFYYLKNELVKLNLALIHFAFDNLIAKGYTPMWTPYLLRHKPIEAAAELEDFKDQLYKIEGEELYLIATAEQTLAAFHMDEVLDANNLPMKYVGFSTNFRKEAGSHGKDTKGIFRVHQFDKVEQFIFCKPESSNAIHEDMVRVTEELFQKLGLPYRVISIPAQDLNDNAAKKYDIEVWFPAQKQYRELISVSNCTDYQARKLNVRFGQNKDIAHTLNGTAIATERTICAILENFQQKDSSVKIPEVLHKYTGFTEIKKKS